jgi:peptide subunit release factor 1 (eRF1)
MTHPGVELLRELAGWQTSGRLVTSLYLTVDGRRHPRKADYEVRLDEQLRRARAALAGLDRERARRVEADLATISTHVREGFDRGDTRALALFSCHEAGLWKEVRLPRPVRDRISVEPQPDVLPLQQLFDTHRPMCFALLDHRVARLFLLELGRVVDVVEMSDDLPNRHDRGGWAQMRLQRHVDDHRARHVRRAADALLTLHRRRGFERLVLAGPAEAHVELEKVLHDYVRRLVRGSVVMPVTASTEDVARAAMELEEAFEREAEVAKSRELLEAAADGRGVTGLERTLAALGERRVSELVVSLEGHAPGAECATCGWLAERDGRCPVCSSALIEVPDVVDAAVAQAVRGGSRVETVADAGLLEPAGGVGALLRF